MYIPIPYYMLREKKIHFEKSQFYEFSQIIDSIVLLIGAYEFYKTAFLSIKRMFDNIVISKIPMSQKRNSNDLNSLKFHNLKIIFF